MTDSEKEKPDGWVAWHPKHGSDIYTASAVSADFPRSNLMRKHFCDTNNDPQTNYETALDASYWGLWERLEKDGWRIRPVKLQFLDEDI